MKTASMALGLLVVLVTGVAAFQDDAKSGNKPLAEEQDLLFKRYGEFETVLQRMSDMLRAADPERAALLSKVFSQSKKDLVALQLAKAAGTLREEDLNAAIKQQQAALADMSGLLELMLSEDQAKKVQERREQMEKYLKEIERLRSKQKDIRAETERSANKQSPSGENKDLSDKQGKLSNDAKNLSDQIEKNDAKAKSENQKPSLGQNSPQNSKQGKDGSPDDKKQGDEKAKKSNKETRESKKQDGAKEPNDKEKDGEKKGSDSKGGDSKQGDSENRESRQGEGQQGESKQGKPQNGGQPQEGQQGGDQDQKQQDDPNKLPDDTPGKKNVEKASKSMEDAQKKLNDNKKQDASKSQDDAIRELNKAIEELEEILRQLREEERQQRLAGLEARLQRVLEMQKLIFDSTGRLEKTPAEKRTRVDEQKAVDLSRREETVSIELGQTLLILKEDGTAVVMPEVLIQAQSDANLVVELLKKADTGAYTQRLESDIIDAIQEMIEALRQEMQKNKDKDQQKKDGDSGGGEKQNPLLDAIAELKLIRSLQFRVQQRTEWLTKAAKDGKSPVADMQKTMVELVDRQARIYDLTKNIVLGKNR